jgi:hypothetical protein
VRSTPKEPDGRRKCDGGREKSAGLRGDPCGTQTAKCIVLSFYGRKYRGKNTIELSLQAVKVKTSRVIVY